MIVLTGQTRGAKWEALHRGYGFGEMTQPPELPARRSPWVFDNHAFKLWQDSKPFDMGYYYERFQYAHQLVKSGRSPMPIGIILPDKVAEGLESLRFSMEAAPWLEPLGAPLFLPVQDGMSEDDVLGVIGEIDGIFVGGSLEWKLRTGEAWVRFAHLWGKPCHIGRVGTRDKVRWARRIGADRIDSSLPNFSEGNMGRFLSGFTDPATMMLPGMK